MAITAPINKDITITKGMESIPSLEISNTYRFADSLHRSGFVNTRFINSAYCPNVCKQDVKNNIFISLFLNIRRYGKPIVTIVLPHPISCKDSANRAQLKIRGSSFSIRILRPLLISFRQRELFTSLSYPILRPKCKK